MDFLWVASLVSVSYWWIPLSSEPKFECFQFTNPYSKHISPAIPPINRVIILGFHTNSILVGISILNIGIREPKFVEEEKEGEEALV